MPMKASGRGTNLAEIDRFDGGVGWLAHPDEDMLRASHALRAAAAGEDDGDADVWVVDPVDAEGLDDLLADLGEVRGVVVLMDRHGRDAAAVADRHGVDVHVPPFVDPEVDGPTVDVSGTLPGTDYEVVQTVNWGWNEAALYDGETLVVADAFGTAGFFKAGDEPLGVHPFLRVKPPRALRQFTPERVLVGHGAGVMDGGAEAVADALDNARRRAPRAWFRMLRSLV